MSINYCTISTTTVDGFCGNQRAKVLARLLEEKYPVVNPPIPSPGIGSGGWTFGPISGTTPVVSPPRYAPHRPEIDRVVVPYEQPWVTVTVSDIFSFRGSETLETTARLDFVMVTDVKFNDEHEITVNITEMEISHA